ncbi:GMP synthase [glutamine-hydrolyzing] [Moellerella wisconsensis]|nr:GMP synthase [glutamine-hydrolyzing] [Moellerella wisconsensis]
MELFFRAALKSTTAEDSPARQSTFFVLVCLYWVSVMACKTMSMQLGGAVEVSGEREFGYAQVEIKQQCELFQDIHDSLSEQGAPVFRCLDEPMAIK